MLVKGAPGIKATDIGKCASISLRNSQKIPSFYLTRILLQAVYFLLCTWPKISQIAVEVLEAHYANWSLTKSIKQASGVVDMFEAIANGMLVYFITTGNLCKDGLGWVFYKSHKNAFESSVNMTVEPFKISIGLSGFVLWFLNGP